MTNFKKYFLTFGGPDEYYHQAVNRLCIQATKMDFFDVVLGLTEKDLINDKDFWNKHGEFINNNSKGYGYWLWKSYIIKKTLEKMNNGDILLYCDSGCEINYYAKNKFLTYIDLVKEKKILGTNGGSTDYNYTKMDLIKYFKMEDEIEILKKPHMQANYLLIYKCDEMSKLINEWYTICSNNYHLIDDSQTYKNFDGFIDHRHDQSIFSLLVKKYNYLNYDLDPSWTSNFYDNDIFTKQTINWPIWVARNKSGNSILDYLTQDISIYK